MTMTELPEHLFGEHLFGWSLVADRRAHLVVGQGGRRRTACGNKLTFLATVDRHLPLSYKACRTCLGWLPPGDYVGGLQT